MPSQPKVESLAPVRTPTPVSSYSLLTNMAALLILLFQNPVPLLDFDSTCALPGWQCSGLGFLCRQLVIRCFLCLGLVCLVVSCPLALLEQLILLPIALDIGHFALFVCGVRNILLRKASLW